MTLRISLDLHELTCGQLIDFADAARAWGVDRDTTVVQVPYDQDENIVERFDLEVTGQPRQARVLTADQAERFGVVLQSVIDGDGDARTEISALAELRDVLRG